MTALRAFDVALLRLQAGALSRHSHDTADLNLARPKAPPD